MWALRTQDCKNFRTTLYSAQFTQSPTVYNIAVLRVHTLGNYQLKALERGARRE